MYSLYLAYNLKNNFKKYLVSNIFCSSVGLSVKIKRSNLLDLVFFLKNSSLFFFKSLIDIFGVDLLGKAHNYRFLVYYILYNRISGFTLTLKVALGPSDVIDTLSYEFKSASWLEREVFDMFGIFFFKNGDMRRILTDYGFEGYPLRKDFPLTGFFEVQYSEEEKVVVSQATKLTQAMRLFHFSSVWNVFKNK